jgi:SAM-dependent methyltransferase
MMKTDIERQYDEIIAPHYDLDPQQVTTNALKLALAQLAASDFERSTGPLDVFDVGIGTGLFCERLRAATRQPIRPHGLDISERMLQVAQSRIPDLRAARDDAANLGRHFPDSQFDLICTHFITGFVPISVLAPEVHRRLKPGGYWSFVGGTSQGFPELQRVARSPLIRRLHGGRELDLGGLKTPYDQSAVESVMREHSFSVHSAETFAPRLDFHDFDAFMAFAWRGAWLTPYIEQLGLHQTGKALRTFFNLWIFPISDSHRIVVALGRKPFPGEATIDDATLMDDGANG